jgi:hypothetical protein
MGESSKYTAKTQKRTQSPVQCQPDPDDAKFLALWHAIKDLQRRIDALEMPVQGRSAAGK